MANLSTVSYFLNITLIRLIAAIAIIIIGLLFARFLSKLSLKVLNEFKLNDFFKDELKLKLPFEEMVSRFVMYIISFIALIIALNELGLTATVLYFILVAVLLIIVILIILAFKDFVPNITAGIYIHQRRNIKTGDYISINNLKGKVVDINLIETRIKISNGDEVLVPNSMLLKSEVRKIKAL